MPTITFAFKGKVTMSLLNWNYNYNHRISKYNKNIYLKTLLHKKIEITLKNIKKCIPRLCPLALHRLRQVPHSIVNPLLSPILPSGIFNH